MMNLQGFCWHHSTFRSDHTCILLQLTYPAIYFVFTVFLVNKRILAFCLRLFGFLFYFVVHLATLSVSNPGVLYLVRGLVIFGKILYLCGQHGMQCTKWRIYIFIYIYLIYTCLIVHHWYKWCCRPVAWKLRFQATGRQHRGCIIPQAVTHSLVLLKMGKIISRNMLSWLELLIKCYFCI